MSLANKFAERMLQLKMSARFYFRICLVIVLFQIAVVFGYTKYFNPDWNEIYEKFKFGMSMIIPLIKSGELNQAATTLTVNLGALCDELLYAFWRSFVLWLVLPMVWIYEMLPSENEDKQIIGGKQFINPSSLNHEMFKRSFIDVFWRLKLKKSLEFGEVYLPVKEEPKQTFAVGKPGVGKTNFINYILRHVIKRRQKGIIHDFKGDYVEKFYDDTRHKLFNPLDERSVHWCLFNDCFSVIDIEAYAWALIPNANSGEPYWNNAARDIFTGVLYYCYYKNKRTNKDIWRTLNLPNGALYAILKQTKGGELGAKHLEDPDGRTAQSIMSNLMTFVKSFQFMQHMDGDFSITKWLTDPKEESLIFITNYANLENTLKPIIALFIQTVGKVLLSQTDDPDRRIFFFLDEFGQLPNMMTIKNMMTASRSKGGSIFIGVQDIGQIDQLYKKDLRMTILNSASNRLVFNCKDGDTAEFFSKDIGEIEYYETVVNNSIGGGSSDRVSIENRKIKERLVKKEDIQSLPDLRAFVGIGHHDIVYSKWKYLKLKKNAPAFIQRSDLMLENISDVQPFMPDNSLVPSGQQMQPEAPSIEDFAKINLGDMPSFEGSNSVDITNFSKEIDNNESNDSIQSSDNDNQNIEKKVLI
jgi:hypothetical protein